MGEPRKKQDNINENKHVVLIIATVYPIFFDILKVYMIVINAKKPKIPDNKIA